MGCVGSYLVYYNVRHDEVHGIEIRPICGRAIAYSVLVGKVFQIQQIFAQL